MNYTVYILRTSSNTFYTGQTNNLEKRLKEHKNKTSKSAKYMRSFKSFKLVYSETHPALSQALKREAELKKLSHTQKETLINAILDR
ncbi:MAG: GIY-YIG nuclease family protein [Candidatus Levybacteria bacterium]|nr:GIY-YIG nuclease family protein [Candidatus Levybacteria bacterium]